MSKRPSTLSERWFRQYLGTHGYVWTYEPDLGIPKKPDFLVSRGTDKFVCDVKEFDPEASKLAAFEREIVLSGQAMAYWVEDFPDTLRNGIRDKAKQLKKLEGCGLPLVIVLANPHQAPVDLSADGLVEAIAGDLGVSFAYDPSTGEARSGPRPFFGRNGVLRRDLQYISAVVALRPTISDLGAGGEEISAHVVHVPGRTATPLPSSVFDSPVDTSRRLVSFCRRSRVVP